jgi:hypothetical protein
MTHKRRWRSEASRPRLADRGRSPLGDPNATRANVSAQWRTGASTKSASVLLSPSELLRRRTSQDPLGHHTQTR